MTVDHAITKANTLIEAMGWIRRFRGKVTVIKLGGSVLDDSDALAHILTDVIFMETVGLKPVVVHGGGKTINRALIEAGIEPLFRMGRRVTDDATLSVVNDVLGGELNRHVTTEIERLGGRAMNLSPHTTNVLFGKPLKLTDAEGQPVDLGHVGVVTRVDRNVIENLHYCDQVPIIPSMCLHDVDEFQNETLDGKILPPETNDADLPRYNVNADTAAMAVAQALGADKLVFLSDVNGVRRDPGDADSIIESLTATEARQLIADGTVAGGMIPKVEACLETLDRGVRKVHIVDGRLRHSLLLEIFTTSGVGTEIRGDQVAVASGAVA